jgi:ubiquinone/menaquinone biosynthesis C-methylase UbiE
MRYGVGSVEALVEPYEPFANVVLRNTIQQRFEIPTLARLLGLPKGGEILEVGCGRGVAFAPLVEHCAPASLTAIDIDPALVAEARGFASGAALDVDVLEADVRELPFPANSFDLVVDFGTCYHVAQPDRALREISRILRRGGLLVHETSLAQLCSHPDRFCGRSLPWAAARELVPRRKVVFWATREKIV